MPYEYGEVFSLRRVRDDTTQKLSVRAAPASRLRKTPMFLPPQVCSRRVGSSLARVVARLVRFALLPIASPRPLSPVCSLSCVFGLDSHDPLSAVFLVSFLSPFLISLVSCCLSLPFRLFCPPLTSNQQRRYMYSKFFCALTSSQRARKHRLPYFSLKNVANIRVWLALRAGKTWLRRHRRERRADAVVSSAFFLCLALLAAILAEVSAASVWCHPPLPFVPPCLPLFPQYDEMRLGIPLQR